MQTRITSVRSIPSSLDSSSGVRWFAISPPFERKKPGASRRTGSVTRVCAGIRGPAFEEQPSPGTIMAPADDRNVFGNPFEERAADVKDVRLRYFVGGEGPPLLLLHGLAGGASNWADLAPLLAGRHRVLVPDLPGHGRSTALPAAVSLEPFVDRVARLALREGFEQAAVVGHSLGGLIGLRLAVRRPEHVRALVLAASAGIRSATREAERFLAAAAFLRPGTRYARHRHAIANSRLLRNLVFGYFGASDPAAMSKRAVHGFLAPLRLHTDTASARR